MGFNSAFKGLKENTHEVRYHGDGGPTVKCFVSNRAFTCKLHVSVSSQEILQVCQYKNLIKKP